LVGAGGRTPQTVNFTKFQNINATQERIPDAILTKLSQIVGSSMVDQYFKSVGIRARRGPEVMGSDLQIFCTPAAKLYVETK